MVRAFWLVEEKKKKKGELDSGCSGAGGSNAARRDWTETSGSSGNGREIGLWSIAQRAPFFFLLDEGTKKWTELRERSDILNCFHTDSVRAFF